MRSFFVLVLFFGLFSLKSLFSQSDAAISAKKAPVRVNLNQKQNANKQKNKKISVAEKIKKPKESLDNKGIFVSGSKNMPVNLSKKGGSANHPQIAADSSGRYVYAIWKWYNGTNTVIQTARSADYGIVWTGAIKKSLDLSQTGNDADVPQITASASGRFAYAVWIRFNGANWIAQTAKSSDYGQTWTDFGHRALDLSQDGKDAGSPQIATDENGRHVYAVWKWHDKYGSVIQIAKSSDFGQTWTSPKKVTGKYPFDLSQEYGWADAPRIITSADGRHVYAIWKRFGGINTVIQTVRSSDFGASWTNPGLTTGSLPPHLSRDGQNADAPQIAADKSGRYVYAIWKRYNGANGVIQTAKSSDFGQTWTNPKTVTGNALPNLSQDGQNANMPRIAASESGRYVYALWKQYNGANNVIQTVKSSDFGSNWTNPLTVTGSHAPDLSQDGRDADMPQITTDASGEFVFAIWKRSNGPNGIIQAAKSSDFGASWTNPIVAKGSLSGNLSQGGQSVNYPRITADISGKYVYAIWYRNNGIDNIIQAVKLPDYEIAGESIETEPRHFTAPPSWYKNRFLVEFKPEYFMYQDSTFREIFGSGGFLAVFGFDARAYKNLHAWLDVGYLHDKGKIKQADNAKITISFVPVSIGLKYQFKATGIFNLYSKIGPSWFHITNKNYYPYFDQKITKMGFGFTLGVGCLIDIYSRAYLDIIADYLYLRKKFTCTNSNLTTDVYIGGLAIGAGIGCKF